MTRTLVTAILLTLFSQTAWSELEERPVTSELANDYNVSRLEFSLQNIKNELQQKFADGNRPFHSLGYIEVVTGFDEDKNLIGIMIDATCKIGSSVDQALHIDIADLLARDAFYYLGNFGQFEEKNLNGEKILHRKLGTMFSRNLFTSPTDNNKLLKLGESISNAFLVRVAVGCNGSGSTYEYKLNSNFSRSAPIFADKDRQLIYKFLADQ